MSKQQNNLFISSFEHFKIFILRRQTLYAGAVVAILLFVIFHLSLIPHQAAQVEIDTLRSSNSIQSVAQNPLYLPYKLVVLIFSQFSDSIRPIRAISIVIFAICVIALFRIIKRWHSTSIALLTTPLFATSAYALAVGRLATPIILLISWPIIIALLLWLRHGSSKRIAPFILALIASGLVYIPGAPYFFLFLIALFYKQIKRAMSSFSSSTIGVSIFVALFVSTPLVTSFINQPGLFLDWLLMPNTIDWVNVPRDILRIPSAFIYRAPIDPLLNVGRLPIFDVASGGLFLVGLYAYQRHIKLERTKVFIVAGLFGCLLGALGQLAAAIVLLLPFAVAIMAAGISYLLDQWYTVFPKNPFARSFGLLLIIIVVSASCYYQLTRFLVVWPQAPETRQIYNQSRLIQ